MPDPTTATSTGSQRVAADKNALHACAHRSLPIAELVDKGSRYFRQS
jgi:hypothetical protein